MTVCAVPYQHQSSPTVVVALILVVERFSPVLVSSVSVHFEGQKTLVFVAFGVDTSLFSVRSSERELGGGLSLIHI